MTNAPTGIGLRVSGKRRGESWRFGGRAGLVAACLGFALAAPGSAGARPSTSLHDPRPASWVLDTTGSVGSATRARLDTIAATVRGAGNGELVVVVTDSVDGESPRTYATRVFNSWRLGSAGTNEGVLIFAALTDHKAEIVLGDGLDSPAEVQASQRIMQSVMLPHFKDDDPNGALVAGAEACAADLLGVPVEGATAASTASDPDASTWTDDQLAGSALGGGGVLLGLVFVGREVLRRRPRRCPRCAQKMVRLGEVEDDAHLSTGEQVEEQVGSVDYDVWMCACGAAEKLRYGAIFTRYSPCGRCQAKTTKQTTTTLQSATTHSEGLARVDETCAHCGHHRSFTRSIPRVVHHDTSSGGGGGGGGSSSGAGASGSW